MPAKSLAPTTIDSTAMASMMAMLLLTTQMPSTLPSSALSVVPIGVILWHGQQHDAHCNDISHSVSDNGNTMMATRMPSTIPTSYTDDVMMP